LRRLYLPFILVPLAVTVLLLLTNLSVLADQGECEVRAVNLIGAWVDAGASKDEPFEFTAADGETKCQGTFAEDILPLFTQENVWAPNTPACKSCHFAVDKNSAHELDLSSYEGIMTGADSLSNPDNPVKIVVPGDWKNSKLRSRLRDNRMPPGMPFDVTEANRDGPVVKAGKDQAEVRAVNLIGAWVDAGAPKDEPFTFVGEDGKEHQATFQEDVLRLFTEDNIWAKNTASCKSCHFAVDKNSAHELDLSSYEGIMTGADSLSNPDNPVKIVVPGDWKNSKLRSRLRDNRMPPGMPFDVTEANRDGPVVHAGRRVSATPQAVETKPAESQEKPAAPEAVKPAEAPGSRLSELPVVVGGTGLVVLALGLAIWAVTRHKTTA